MNHPMSSLVQLVLRFALLLWCAMPLGLGCQPWCSASQVPLPIAKCPGAHQMARLTAQDLRALKPLQPLHGIIHSTSNKEQNDPSRAHLMQECHEGRPGCGAKIDPSMTPSEFLQLSAFTSLPVTHFDLSPPSRTCVATDWTSCA
jgi:hypothetical protein